MCGAGRIFGKQVKLKLSFVFRTLAALLCCATAFAQTGTGTLRGQVTDPSGAVIPNAQVTVSTSGSPNRSATSDGSGFYQIGNLPAGKYSVTVTAKGFAP